MRKFITNKFTEHPPQEAQDRRAQYPTLKPWKVLGRPRAVDSLVIAANKIKTDN